MQVWEMGALGDVNSDGFDDVLFARRELVFNEQTETYCSLRRGPAELMLGSPAGLVEEPLWEMYALGYPNTGVGRLVARIGQPAVRLKQSRRSEILVLVPPVAGA